MANRRKTSGRPSPLRRLLRIVSGLAGVVVVAAIALFLIGTVGIFAPMRTAAVETILSGALGATVDIEGTVAIGYGSTVTVSGDTIRIERPEGAPSGEADTIEAATIGFGARSLLAGRFDLTSLRLKGVSLADNSRLVGFDPDAAISSDRRWFGIVPGMVRIAKGADIAISEAHYRYHNAESGWEFDITVADVATDRNASSDSTTLTMSGTVNGQAVKIEGDIHPLMAGDTNIGDGFTLTATGPGGSVSMRSIVPSDPSKTLREVVINADATSIGDMLDTLKIARSVDGTATLNASIDASGTVSAARDLKADVSLKDGFSFQISGSIADLEQQKGFDLAVDATFPPDSDEDAQKEGLLAFDIYDVKAHLSGDLGALAMDEGWITTNLFSDALPRLGPITAGDIRRDDEGRLAVDDIEVLAGPADQRTFDLKGRIGDLLKLSDFRLAGDVSIPTAQVIGLATSGDAALGRLTGRFAVSDATGEAGIDTFTAKLTGSSLVSADINLTANQTGPEETTSFDLTFDVPDYAKLATVLGVTAEPVGAIRYKGDLTLSPHAGALEGRLNFGKMDVTGTLAVKEDKGRPLVTGDISTPLLTLADARRMVSVAQSLRGLDAEAVSQQAHSQLRPVRPRFDVTVSADKVEGAGEAASSVSGRLLVDDGTVIAESFELTFDGGHFGFNGQMNVREESRPFSAKGKVNGWPLDKVLKELQLDLPITGILHAAFDLSSSGRSVDVAFREAKGDLDTRITGGVIGNRMLDLTGLVLPSWLLSESAKSGTSQVDCLTASIRFDPGLATVRTATVETDEVIVKAAGKIDFTNDTIDIQAEPKALSPNLIPIVSPFAIEGKLSDPKVVVKGGGVVGRGVAETLALPLNTLGSLLGVDKTGPKPEEIVASCK